MRIRLGLGKNFKKVLIGIAAVSLVTIGSVSTHAAFSNTGQSNLVFNAGEVKMQLDNKAMDESLLPIAFGTENIHPRMAPITRQVTIKNNGNVPMIYYIFDGGGYPLDSKLNLEVKHGTTVLYNGSIQYLWTADSPKMQAGTSAVITFTLTWPPTSDDKTFAGNNSWTTLVFNAKSAP